MEAIYNFSSNSVPFTFSQMCQYTKIWPVEKQCSTGNIFVFFPFFSIFLFHFIILEKKVCLLQQLNIQTC